MPRSAALSRNRTIADVKAHFAECIREAEAGHVIVVTRHGRPVARLEPIAERSSGVSDTEQPAAAEVGEPPASYPKSSARVSVTPEAREAALHAFLVEQIWPRIPKDLLGRGITKREREEILGYAPSTGVSDENAHGRR